MNALGYVLAGPLPNQVLLSRNFKEARGKAMGIAYVGIGIGFFFVPQITKYLHRRLRLADRADAARRAGGGVRACRWCCCCARAKVPPPPRPGPTPPRCRCAST